MAKEEEDEERRKKKKPAPEGHPLFPVEEGQPPRIVETIHVSRTGSGTHVHPFGPDELTSLEQLYEMFGGGRYQLLARNKNQISGRAAYVIEGPSKPLNDVAPEVLSKQQNALMGDGNFMLGLMTLMQQQQATQLAQMQAASRAQTDLVLAMLNQGSNGSQQHIEMMQRMQAQHTESQAALFNAILSAQGSKNNGGNTHQSFMQGIQFARDFIDAERPDDSNGDDDLLETMLEVAAGFMQHQHQPAPAPAPTPEPSPKKDDDDG